ncbi:hypothetical protein ABPG75_000296 [Micractinium tetrahymenae]
MSAAEGVPAEPPPRSSPLQSQLKTSRSQSERALLQAALAWLQALGVEGATSEPPADAGALFSDCWLLGRTADAVQAARRGEADAWRPPPSPLGSTPGTRQRRTFRDRINDYSRLQQVCRELGLRADVLPPLTDIEAGQGTAAVAACLWEVAEQCTARGLPVPAFGDARSVLRRSMPREASARRAEKFACDGSPPKRPSIGPLLTPRAFNGKGGATMLRNSNGSLREVLQRNSAHKVDARAGHDGHAERDLVASSGGLSRTIAELERAAAEAEQLRSSPAPAGPSSHQPWRRPVLPRLDVEAAAAQAAAEAAEGGSTAGPGGLAGAWAGDDSSPSPLSSPDASSMASPSPGGYGSSSAGSSPERHRGASPARRAFLGHISPSRIDNPLWSQSPQSQGLPSRGAAAAPPAMARPAVGWDDPEPAGTPASTSRTRSEHVPEMGSPLIGTAVGSGAASPARGSNLRASFDSMGGGDGGLLESLLYPPALKPAHTRLLGALMHTAGPARDAAAAVLKAEQQAQLHEQAKAAADAGESETEEVEEAVPVEDAVAAVASSPTKERVRASPAKAPLAVPPAPATQAAQAAAAAQAEPAPTSSGGGARRLAFVLLSAVAGAAAAAAAGAVQQRRRSGLDRRRGDAGRRLPVLHAQPVPSMRDAERKTHSQEELEERQRKASRGKRSSKQAPAPVSWDNPHAVLTQG